VYSNVIGEPVIPDSVGKKLRLTESKLSGGDHVEIIVRGPSFYEVVDNVKSQSACNLLTSISYQEANLMADF
jgi:hypothetical protein